MRSLRIVVLWSGPLPKLPMRLGREVVFAQRLEDASLQIVKGYFPDLVLITGSRLRIDESWLDAFPDRIFAVTENAEEAILAGKTETRATLSLVVGPNRAGFPVLRSWPVAVTPLAAEAQRLGAHRALQACLLMHHEKMRETVGPLLQALAHLVASGRLQADKDGVRIDGAPAPFELEEGGGLMPGMQPMYRPITSPSAPLRS